MTYNFYPSRRPLLTMLLVAVIAFTFLPWAADTLFNTKGEPREAIVAMSMLHSGNFILPESYGTDIPYKPPLLAWLIAASTVFTGGEVTEFSSRLPSIIATIALITCGFIVYAKRRGDSQAMTMALVTLTSVEVFRAASACRVDMVLTACMVIAIYLMFEAREAKGRPVITGGAVALMTLAVMTKGPVGAALPCLAMWVYCLLRGDSAVRAALIAAAGSLLALVIPAVWYYAAWTQGGERFLHLAMEENFGRLTGTMSYGSHENPWWYNFVTVIAGMAPYTLLALMSLFAIRRRKGAENRPGLRERIAALRPETLLALTVTVVIFVFYCIPKSKRSVYLLPIYPFLAYFVTLLIDWLMLNGRRRIVGIYAGVIAGVGLIAAWTVWGFHMVSPDLIPDMGKSGAELLDGLRAEHFSFINWALIILCIVVCGATLCAIGRRPALVARGALLSALSIYWVASSTVLPCVLNPKSDITIVRRIQAVETLPQGIYSYNSAKMLRYYTAAFYLGDRIRLFAPEQGSSQSTVGTESASLPAEGLLIIGQKDLDQWQQRFGSAYATDTLWTCSRKSCDSRQIPMLIHFTSTPGR